MQLAVLGLIFLACDVLGTVYFEEDFFGMLFYEIHDLLSDDNWRTRWVQPTVHESDWYGRWELSRGSWYGNYGRDLGLMAVDEDKHYHLIAPFTEHFDTRDKDFVVQYSVKYTEEKLGCIGAYVKLGSGSDIRLDQLSTFHENTSYSVLFGPDLCKKQEKVVLELRVRDKYPAWLRDVVPRYDKFAHVYTLWVRPDNTYEVLVDGKTEMKGALSAHFENFPKARKMVYDRTQKKPADWDGKKWLLTKMDDGSILKKKNPNFMGKWRPRKIPNPEFENEKKAYMRKLDWIAFEDWMVKKGTIFDHLLVTDDIILAKGRINEVLEGKETEKKMHEDWKKAKNARNSEIREENLARQKKEREERERTKVEREAREREEKERKLARLQEEAELERLERVALQQELLAGSSTLKERDEL